MFAPWKKSYVQPRQHIKDRDITLLAKVHTVKAMVFPVVMYGSESWTIKKVEHWRIDAFDLWCWRRLFSFFLFFWRRLFRVLLTARRSNQSVLKEISPECCSPWAQRVRHNWATELNWTDYKLHIYIVILRTTINYIEQCAQKYYK